MPILSKFLIRSFAVRGKVVARLYYINSLGAVCGTILAGFYLIQRFGLEASITIAALINMSIGVAVVLLRIYCDKIQPGLCTREEAIITEEGQASAGEESFSDKVVSIALAGIFLSGFAAMLYELVWIRLLSTILGSSSYSFSLMLAAFISGVTIGSFLISKFMPRSKYVFLAFGLCEVCIGIFLIFSLPFYEKLPLVFFSLSKIFARRPDTFFLYSGAKFLLSFLVMLVPTIFFGMTLPLVSKIASRKMRLLGSKIGTVFAFNTAGDILGALVTGLLLIPLFGLRPTLEVGVVINICLGLMVIFVDHNLSPKRKVVLAATCSLIFAAYKIVIPDWNRIYFSKQLFRCGIARDMIVNPGAAAEDKEILFYKDGLEASVSVVKDKEILTLYINGKADASTGADMPAQVLCAQLPLLLKPQAEDVLIVGLGSGITCGCALLHPIKSLDTIEISSTVVEANSHFSGHNYDVLKDERLKLHIEDAKTFLQRQDKKYDLIINEPSNPWLSGVGGLFSREFFTDCLQRLNDDGLMVQWVQAYETNDEIYRMVLRTFTSVFPQVTVWNAGTLDTILVGSKEEIKLDFTQMEKRMNREDVSRDLARIGLRDIYTLLSLQLSSQNNLQRIVEEKGVVHSDYFPVLDYLAPLALYTGQTAERFLIELDERKLSPEKISLFIKAYLNERKIDNKAFNNFFAYADKQLGYNKNFVCSLVKRWYRDFPKDRQAILAYSTYNIDFLEDSIAALEKIIRQDSSFQHLDRYASLQMERYWIFKSYLLPEVFSQLEHSLHMCIELCEDKKAKFYYHLGKAYYGNQEYQRAIDYYSRARRLLESKEEDALSQGLNLPGLLNEISIAYLKEGDLNKAFEYAVRVLRLEKDNFLAHSLIRTIQARLQ